MLLILLYHKVIKSLGFDLWWRTFDYEMRVLKSSFRVVDLDDVAEYLERGRLPSKPTVALTFDDGYADNYVYAYPILKKHGLKATLFVTTSRILKSNLRRKTLLDYWQGKASFRELHQPKSMYDANYEFLEKGFSEDFLSVEELNSMRDVFSFGWHSHNHTKSFCSEEIQDLYDGKGHWSLTHAYGEKPKRGYPVFPLKGSLSVKAGKLRRDVKAFISSLDDGFFKRRAWKEELKRELRNKFSSFLEFESDEERLRRVEEEVLRSKRELENMTGHRILHGAYPFGDYDAVLKGILSKHLLTAYTTQKSPVREDTDPYLIPRITVPKDIWSFLAILTKASLPSIRIFC